MKKLLIASILAALFVGTLNVSAMTEEELRKRFDETVVIEGATYGLTAGEKKAADDYLANHELSSADCDYISSKMDEAKTILHNEGKGNLKKMSESTKNKLKQLVADIAANTSVKATVTTGALVILNEDGSTFYEATKLVKQTSTASSSIAIIAGCAFVVTLVGACLIIKQVKNNNN